MSPPDLLGAVLAGGEGRRMGGPKAGSLVGGQPLVSRAVATLQQVFEEVVVVSARPVPDAIVEVVPDRVAGAGPLAGLEAALLAASERGRPGVLLLACDLPLVDSAVVAAIASALGPNAVVAPERSGGGVEPLCAAYSVELLPAVGRRLQEKDRSLHALFKGARGVRLSAERIGAEGRHPFLNVNRPDDVALAEKALAERRSS